MSARTSSWPPAPAELRARFAGGAAYTIGIEDEVLLLDPQTHALVARAGEVLARLDGDQRFKLELPASQIEIVTPVAERVPTAAAALLDARRALAGAAAGIALPAGAGVHPFSDGRGALNDSPRYAETVRRYAAVASRQLVCALQVHVHAGEAERALAIYNAARGYVPLIAALAANAPFYEGADTGLASVRPALCNLLPRQGVPPPIGSFEELAEIFRIGAVTGAFPDGRTWWWELRLHPSYGTLEFRVPDGQSTVADAAAVAALVQSLVAWLGGRHDAGERLATPPTWRIEENRWSAARHGVEGEMIDLERDELRPTRGWLRELVADLTPVAQRLGCAAELGGALELADRNGAMRQRAVAAGGGARAVAAWLAARFAEPPA